MKLIVTNIVMVAAVFAFPALANAQRTDNNAVTSAEDAFGKSVGDQSIGIYGSDDVRGFSPSDAGNVRIEGLYFDKQAFLTDRVQPGSTIRVGISAQGYPFPAPTGIVDYELRRAGGKRIASVALEVGPFGGKSAEFDVLLPIDGDRLGVAAGAGIYRDINSWGGSPNFFSSGVTLRYAPRPGIEIIPFWGRVRLTDVEAEPRIFTAGKFLPKRAPRGRFFGQSWADKSGTQSSYGLVARADPAGFDMRFGLFRSISDDDRSYADLLFDTDQAGRVARRLIVREDNVVSHSTSGELRVARTFEDGARRHTIIASLRGRQQRRSYGGAQAIDLGASWSDRADPRLEQVTVNGPQTNDRVTQMTYGIGYRGLWRDIGELGFGVQKTQYRKRVTDPNPAITLPETNDSPLLISATGAIYVAPGLAAYAGYTRGLEESPVAPDEAINRNEAPPAIRTDQKDAGIRWTVVKGVTAVAGVFDIAKPYFNLDAGDRFRQLGTVRHRGVELSLTGEIAKGMNLVAGAVFLDARLSGEDVIRGVIGNRPIGAIGRRILISLDYRLPWHDPLSIDSTFEATSSRVASADAVDPLRIPARAVIGLGARYRLTLDRTPVLIRAQVGNVTNTFGWNVGGSGFFVPNGGRRFSMSIAADI